MKTLLEVKHPDISPLQISHTLRFKQYDMQGNLIECLERKNTNEDFVDTTLAHQERIKLEQEIIKEERTITRAKKGIVYLFYEDNNWVDIDGNVYDTHIDEDTGDKLWYRHGKPTVYRLLEADKTTSNCIKVKSE